MNALALRQILKAIGIGSGIIVFGMVVIGGFIAYRNILEAEKLKEQIRLLKQDVPIN